MRRVEDVEDEEEASGRSPRTWTFLLAALWLCLGAWTLTDGRTALGVAQLLLGLAFLVRAYSASTGVGLFRRR
ncbi:hypothetical protein KDN32_08285 [Nocardioides sp. J2M5]|uniref:hypothetical protein n=1 Tax=Nocardioides palaemonis TaxID=2829810 RepID=UPI001BA95F41|nr:hypothetical protein [Nocardioides palaemonis]MBS2937739.1 hypothetical protein [Nocardioides palaemonis]